MKIITGHTGEKHIKAIDDAAVNKLLVGDGDYVLPYGGQLALTTTSAHTVSITNGYLITQGRLATIRIGEDESFNFANGSANYYTTDLLVAEYTMNSGTGIEDISLKIIEGGQSQDAPPDDPSITTGNIDNGDTHQIALWRVVLYGTSIYSTERVTAVVDHAPIDQLYSDLNDMEAEIEEAISEMNTTVSSKMDEVDTEVDTAINQLTDFYYASGSTITIGSYIPCAGTVYGSSKSIGFLIPTKPIIGASITINSLKLTLREVTGGIPYIKSSQVNGLVVVNNSAVSVTGISSISASIVDGGIKIILTTSAAMLRSNKKTNMLTNAPVSVYAQGTFTVG